MNKKKDENTKYHKLTLETHFYELSLGLSRRLVKSKAYKLLAIDSHKAMIAIQNDLFFVEIEDGTAKISTKILFHSIKENEQMKSCRSFKQYLFI
jgi:hypothetical protein